MEYWTFNAIGTEVFVFTSSTGVDLLVGLLLRFLSLDSRVPSSEAVLSSSEGYPVSLWLHGDITHVEQVESCITPVIPAAGPLP